MLVLGEFELMCVFNRQKIHSCGTSWNRFSD